MTVAFPIITLLAFVSLILFLHAAKQLIEHIKRDQAVTATQPLSPCTAQQTAA